MVSLSVSVETDDALRVLRQRLAREGFRPAMKVIAETIHSEVVGTFEDQADPWGRQWAPLSDATIKHRKNCGVGAEERTPKRRKKARKQERKQERKKGRKQSRKGDSDGEGKVPRKRARRPRGASQRALVWSGNLRSAIVQKSGTATAIVFVSDKAAAALDPCGRKTVTPTLYAATHQFGRGKIKARPFFLIGKNGKFKPTPEITATIQDILEDHVIRGVADARKGNR